MNMDKTLPQRRESASSRILEIILALIIPPVAVLLNRGIGRELIYSIVLTILGFIPGVVYSLVIISTDINSSQND